MLVRIVNSRGRSRGSWLVGRRWWPRAVPNRIGVAFRGVRIEASNVSRVGPNEPRTASGGLIPVGERWSGSGIPGGRWSRAGVSSPLDGSWGVRLSV